MTEASYRLDSDKRIALIARAAGTYRVEARSLDAGGAGGTYHVRLTRHTPARPGDTSRAAALRHFTAAEALRAAWRRDSNRAAIERYLAALRLFESVNDGAAQAMVCRRLSDVLSTLGDTQRAASHGRRALVLARAAGDRFEEMAALNRLASINLVLGDDGASARDAAEALDLARARGDGAAQAEALNAIGDVQALRGRTRESLGTYAEALAAADRAHDRRQRASALLNLGFSHWDLSEVEEALAAYRQALELQVALGDRRAQAVTFNAMGHLHAELGERQTAIRHYLDASALFEQIGDPVGRGISFNGLGFVYSGLGEHETALNYYRRQLLVHRGAGFRQGEGSALGHIGRCRLELGQPRRALADLKAAILVLEAIEDRKVEAFTRGLLGRAYEATGDDATALRELQRALEIDEAIDDRSEQAYALTRIARVLHRLGRTGEALAHNERALALNRDTHDRPGESLTLYNFAVIERDRGQLDRALARIRESLEVAESLRADVASLDLRASYVASVRERHEFEVDLLVRLDAERPAQGFDRLAFEASERARARSLLDGLSEALAGIREGVDPALVEREAALRRSLHAKAERLSRLGQTPDDDREAAALEQTIERLSLAYRQLEAEVRASSPRYAALTQPQPLSLAGVQQQVVDDQSLLLQYFIGEHRSYLWTVAAHSLHTYTLPGRAEIEPLVRSLRVALNPPASADGTRTPGGADARQESALLTRLSAMLLGPAAGDLGNRRLLISPDGPLHVVPFAALPDPRASSSHAGSPAPLVEAHEVVSVPSASTIALARGAWDQSRRWSRSVMVIADPVFEADDPRLVGPRQGDGRPIAGRETAVKASRANGSDSLTRALRSVGGVRGGAGIPRLLETRREGRAITSLVSDSRLAVDFEASRATATAPDLRDFRIVHFATHGLVSNDHPELSGVVLSLFDARGRPQDGFLRLDDIYNLKLSADLVVLSACSTALGKAVIGEGLAGLVRGFMYAGSRRVIATLWDVDDQATGVLMATFYAGMFRDGLTPSAALRAAQLDLQRRPRWASPRYWAAFVLHGD